MRISILFIVLTLASVERATASPAGEVMVVPENGDGRGVAIAADGTRYLAGGTAIPDSDERQPFLIALDPSGQVRWRLDWEGHGQVVGVAATPAGPVVIVRMRSTNFDADPGPDVLLVEDRDGRSAVAVALSPAGDVRWAWSTPRATLAVLASLPDGAVAIAGTSLDAVGFVAAIDGDGSTTWLRTLGKPAATPYAIAVTDTAIYVTGTGAAPARRVPGSFLARLDLDGGLEWLRRLGTRGSIVKSYTLAADDERVVIGGLFRGRPDLDPGPGRQVRTSVDSDDDAFVAAFTPSGEQEWVYTFGAVSSDQVRGLAVDGGQIYALGSQTEVVDLGGAVGPQDPTSKWFLLTLDGRGVPRASTPVVTAVAMTYPNLHVASMMIDRGRVYITGDISGPSTILGTPVAVARPLAERSPVLIELAVP